MASPAVDCTGDADVAYFADAESIKEAGALSPNTLLLNLGNGAERQVRQARIQEAAHKAPEKYRLIPERCGLSRAAHGHHFFINHADTRDLGQQCVAIWFFLVGQLAAPYILSRQHETNGDCQDAKYSQIPPRYGGFSSYPRGQMIALTRRLQSAGPLSWRNYWRRSTVCQALGVSSREECLTGAHGVLSFPFLPGLRPSPPLWTACASMAFDGASLARYRLLYRLPHSFGRNGKSINAEKEDMAKRNGKDLANMNRDLQAKLGMTQEQFAAKVGVTFSTVNRWENGRGKPSPRGVRRIEELSEGLEKE